MTRVVGLPSPEQQKTQHETQETETIPRDRRGGLERIGQDSTAHWAFEILAPWTRRWKRWRFDRIGHDGRRTQHRMAGQGMENKNTDLSHGIRSESRFGLVCFQLLYVASDGCICIQPTGWVLVVSHPDGFRDDDAPQPSTEYLGTST